MAIRTEYLIAQIQPDKSLLDVEAFVQNSGRQSTYADKWQFKISSDRNTFVGVQKFGQKRPSDVAIDEPELANEEYPVGKPVRGWLYFELKLTSDEIHSIFNCDKPHSDASVTLSFTDTKGKREWSDTRRIDELIQASCKKFSIDTSKAPPVPGHPPLPQVHQKTKSSSLASGLSVSTAPVKGNNNVVGNVVNGDQNIVGNNNQLNIGKYPPRHLPTERLNDVINYLAQMPPQKAMVHYEQGDGEPYGYAKQIADMLRAAKWNVDGPSQVMVISNGEPLYGVDVRYTGEKVQVAGQQITLSDRTPEGRLMLALQFLQNGKDLVADPEPKWTEGVLLVTVHPNPLSKPQ